MSERKIREWAESGGGTIVLCSGDEICADCQELYDALAADPDVVAVLRKGEEAWHSASPTALGDLLDWIRDTFRVRLTPAGYEWTEEATE